MNLQNFNFVLFRYCFDIRKINAKVLSKDVLLYAKMYSKLNMFFYILVLLCTITPI